MGTYAKAARMALSLLAGCAALTQLSSQGAGTNSGGKATANGELFLFADKIPMFNDRPMTNWYENYPTKLSEGEFDGLINKAIVAMRHRSLWVENLPSRDLQRIASMINDRVDLVITRPGSNEISKFGRNFITAEAVCEWVRLNIDYDFDAAEGPASSEGIRQADPAYIMSLRNPKAVCWGIAALTRDLARATGRLECDLVNGCMRSLGTTADPGRNHSIVCFNFKEQGLKIPADVSTARVDTAPRNRGPGIHSFLEFPKGKICEYWVLPRRPGAWELFVSQFTPEIPEKGLIVSGDKQGVVKFLNISRQEWISTPAPKEYANDRHSYLMWEVNRAGGVTPYRLVTGD